jgi:biotin carboxyl carrier protein
MAARGACIVPAPMRRDLLATVGSSDHAIEVAPIAGDRFRVVVDGRAYEIDAVEVRPGSWSLLAGGRSLRVDVDRDAGAVRVSGVAGAIAAELDDARRRQLARATASGRPKPVGEELRAPVAGKVVKLLVELGDSVEVGQGVVVLEAMKMENVLAAERGGKVSRIEVKPGQSVETRALLVVLA